MKVKVYEQPGGAVRVVHPNPRLRRDGESDDEFLERIVALTERHDPTLKAAVAKHTMRAEQLPDRANRARWRVKNGRVEVDRELPEPPGRNR